MKTVLLVRHAKSDWNDPQLKDFDRPLNERGKKDAPEMARRLLQRKVRIDSFISSPAKRAKKTAEIFAKEYGEDKNDVHFIDDLYLAGPDVFFDVIEKTRNKYDTVAIFSHNPGITDFANQLTHVKVDDMPTCGIFVIRIKIKNWSDFRTGEKEFLFFDYPKAFSI